MSLFFFFVFLPFIFYLLGVWTSLENSTTLRISILSKWWIWKHYAITVWPPLLLLNWWCHAVVVCGVGTFNCRLVSINFLSSWESSHRISYDNNLRFVLLPINCRTCMWCVCACVNYDDDDVMTNLLMFFLFFFFFFFCSCTSWTMILDAKPSSTNSLISCRREVRTEQ
jgi:hypothetical protein